MADFTEFVALRGMNVLIFLNASSPRSMALAVFRPTQTVPVAAQAATALTRDGGISNNLKPKQLAGVVTDLEREFSATKVEVISLLLSTGNDKLLNLTCCPRFK